MHRLKRILRNEAGFALPMALVLMLLGSFLVGASVNLAATTLKSNIVVEQRTEGLYAADAGIEDVVWKYGAGVDPFPDPVDQYDLTEQLNGMTVTVEQLEAPEGTTYLVKSTARLNGEVKGEIIAGLVGGFDFAWLFEHAITSGDDIDTSPHDVIYGGVLCEGEFLGDDDQVRTGEIEEGATITLPTPDFLKAFYLSGFDDTVCADPANYCPDNPYTSGTYTIPSGATESNPHMIPWLYRNGDLTMTGNGYGKLGGTIYLTGKLWVAPGTTIDLNGHTIFSEYDSGCYTVDPDAECPGDDAINFQPNCTIYGPGCIIGVGSINYQPNLGVGDQLVGAADLDTEAYTTLQDRFALYKFKATKSGTLSSFQVKCYIADPEAPPAHVKVAVYDDDGSGGAPKTQLGAIDYADNITVISSWNPIIFEETSITNGLWYWLAAMSDSPVISKKNVSSTSNSRYKSETFTGFEFPEDISTETFITPYTEQYMLRGFSNSQEFILVMSVECGVNLQPHASFYGCIVGDTDITLSPWCTINLVGVPEDGLDFPGMDAGSGEGGTTDLEMRTYTIR